MRRSDTDLPTRSRPAVGTRTRRRAVTLAALALTACTTAPPAPPPPSPTVRAGWTELPLPQRTQVNLADLAPETPRHFTDGDVCALLTEPEIVTAASTPYARTVESQPGQRCVWQVGDTLDERGRPVDTVIVQVGGADSWLGEEQGAIAGHPARRRGWDGLCLLRAALRKPVDDTDKRAVLTLVLRPGNPTANACASAQSLAELVLSRLPAAG
ncbi:hypothetical protein GCM10010492_33680 [Saccharothrix mutabilis subsp. mutabilis]|uniref:DUF3558 domain-containing protein n=2 Tax=Saccharothrix mutabilis TaxID=33921 RepID=A0ABN0TX34_9PSEU